MNYLSDAIIQRMTDEDELKFYKGIAENLFLAKETREEALRNIRRLEKKLDRRVM